MSRRRIILAKSWHHEKALKFVTRAYHSEHLWEVTLSRTVKSTTPQKRRYFGLLRELSLYTGHAVDELHDMMKEKFLGSYTLSITDEEPELMQAYIYAIEGWAVGWLGMDVDKSFEV